MHSHVHTYIHTYIHKHIRTYIHTYITYAQFIRSCVAAWMFLLSGGTADACMFVGEMKIVGAECSVVLSLTSPGVSASAVHRELQCSFRPFDATHPVDLFHFEVLIF